MFEAESIPQGLILIYSPNEDAMRVAAAREAAARCDAGVMPRAGGADSASPSNTGTAIVIAAVIAL